MKNERFEPLINSLKNKFNLALLIPGLICLVDLLFGSPIMQRIMTGYLGLRGIDPVRQGFTMITIFGKIKGVTHAAVLFDRAIAVFFLGIVCLSYLRGLYSSLFSKKII